MGNGAAGRESTRARPARSGARPPAPSPGPGWGTGPAGRSPPDASRSNQAGFPRALLLIDGERERARLCAALERLGFAVDCACGSEPIARLPQAPDVVLGGRSFGDGRGSIAVSLVRPCGPADALRVMSRLAEREQRALSKRLGVPREEIARRLADLMPGLSRRAALEERESGVVVGAPVAGRAGFALHTFLQAVEESLIVLMLGCARSDREAAAFLGLNEATLRSKMKKHGIRSPRARAPGTP